MRRRLRLLVAVLVVGLLAAAAIGIARFTADRVLWSASVGAPDAQVRAWLTDDLVVTAAGGSRTVVALAKDDGAVRWTYRLPSGVICSASGGVLKRAVALAYGAGCRGLLLLDLGSVKPRWDVSLPGTITAVEIAGGRVTGALKAYGARKADVVAGFDADTGRQRWVYESECQRLTLRPSGNGFTGDRQRIAFVIACRQGESNYGEVRMLDAASGRLLYKIQPEATSSDVQILTASPLVAYQTVPDPTAAPENSPVLGLVNNVGGVPGLWSPTSFWVKAHPGQRVEDHSAVLDHRFMVVTTETGGWAAWDLFGGRDQWVRDRIASEVDGEQVYADEVVTGGQGVLVKGETRTEPRKAALLRLDPRTGEATPISALLEVGQARSGVWFVDGQRAYVVSGPGRAVAFRIS